MVLDYDCPLASGWLGDIGCVSRILFREVASHFERLGASRYEAIGYSSDIELHAVKTLIFIVHCPEIVSSRSFWESHPQMMFSPVARESSRDLMQQACPFTTPRGYYFVQKALKAFFFLR